MFLFITGSAFAQIASDIRSYEQHCSTCHENLKSPYPIPDGMQLLRMSPETIYSAIAKAPWHKPVQSLSENEKQSVTEYLGGRKAGLADNDDAKRMPNRCSSPLLPVRGRSAAWNGWGADTANSRFQLAKFASLQVDQVPQLKLKWAFGLPDAQAVYGQPTVAIGRVFIGVDTGVIYSLDAVTGCVHWSFQADAGVRNAISIASVVDKRSAKYTIYFGDIKANVYNLDAVTGELLWKVKVDDHPLARITGAPTLHSDRLYVPLSSTEEWVAGLNANYPCCTFRGSVVALNAKTGKQIWKTYVISDPPKQLGKNSNGVERWGPAGGGVWASPTIDAENHTLYISTGDGYVEPAPTTTDALLALNLDTGKLLWSIQDTENDTWVYGCKARNGGGNCPKELGPDFDFGSSPILRTLPDGLRILVAGQKSGIVWAHDADRKGKIVWKRQLVDRVFPGVITFGGAADDETAYFGLKTGGVAAVALTTGDRKWFTPEDDSHSSLQTHGQTAAITGIPGAIFSGGWDGMLRAYSTKDGRQLWEYDTAHAFETVNAVPARGGSMGAPGPIIVGGMLFVGSGYVVGASTPGNVLLAFSPK